MKRKILVGLIIAGIVFSAIAINFKNLKATGEACYITNKGNIYDYPTVTKTGKFYRCTVKWTQSFDSTFFAVTLSLLDTSEKTKYRLWLEGLSAGSYTHQFEFYFPDIGRDSVTIRIVVVGEIDYSDSAGDSYDYTVNMEKPLNPPKLNVTWHVPSQFEYEKPNQLWFWICNEGGDASGENELWISGYSSGHSSWSLNSGSCFGTGWKTDFYLQNKHIEDGYVTLRFWAKLTNQSGTDIYDETKKIPVTGMSGSIKVIVKDESGDFRIEGAKIYLDGSYKGKTNSNGEYTISNLAPNEYKVEASKSGYYDDFEYVYLEAGKTITVYLTLAKERGSMKIIVKDNFGDRIEDAKIYLDGDYMGKTRSDGTYYIEVIDLGNYTVKASKSGYEDDSEQVHVGAGETKTVHLTLDEIPPETTPPPEDEWNNLTPEHSDYLRSGNTVYFNDKIAQMYAPILYYEGDTEPLPERVYYRILKRGKGGIIQYLQYYPKQETWYNAHIPDWSLVYVCVNDDHSVDKIIYDSGVANIDKPDFDWDHISKSVEWKNIPDGSKDGNHVKLCIDTNYHSMKLGSSANRPISFSKYYRLYDEVLDNTYFFPEYDIDIGKTYKTDSLGFDVSCTYSVCEHIENDNISPWDIETKVVNEYIYIEFASLLEAKVKVYLFNPDHVGSPYNVLSGETSSVMEYMKEHFIYQK